MTLSTPWRRLLGAPLAMLAVGCAEPPTHDLEAFVADPARPAARAAAPPVAPPAPTFEYDARAGRDPFEPPARWGADAGPVPSATPDLDRQRSVLEQFAITELRMIGTLAADGVRAALVRDPDGRVHRVHAGDYLGRDFGRVEEVAEQGLEIVESLADGDNGWVTRRRSITLSRAAAEPAPAPPEATDA